METQSGRGWLVHAFSIFLLVLSLWILAALWAGNSFGATFPLLADLRSQIFADYGSDIFGRTLKSLQLTILGDIAGDPSFVSDATTDWTIVFGDPVPTATQMGVVESTNEASDPTETLPDPVHTETVVPVPTNTTEPNPPTKTPKPTSTPHPTKTPHPSKTPKPTPRNEDVEVPVLSGGQLTPPSGELTVCEIEIGVTELLVEDYPWSSGIDWAKLKYRVEGFSEYIYSSPLILKSGGPTGEGGWSGCYSGEVHIAIDPGWVSPEGGIFHVNLWAKAKDHAGHAGYLWLGEYFMPGSCGGNVQ